MPPADPSPVTSPDWGAGELAGPRAGGLAVATVAVIAALAVATGAGVLLGPGVAALLAAVLSGGLVVGWVMIQGRRVLAALGARPLCAEDAPRFVNLVAGLAGDLRMAPPRLWLVDSGGPNALVCRAGGPSLAVTRSLVETFTRTELEAVAAHCLLRAGGSRGWADALAVALGPLGPPRVVGTHEDVRAASVTRYPPALVTAIERAEPPRRGHAFWFVAEHRSHLPSTQRIEGLRGL